MVSKVSQPEQKRREVTWVGRWTGVEIPVVKHSLQLWKSDASGLVFGLVEMRNQAIVCPN